jgi:hypothetical protein
LIDQARNGFRSDGVRHGSILAVGCGGGQPRGRHLRCRPRKSSLRIRASRGSRRAGTIAP